MQSISFIKITFEEEEEKCLMCNECWSYKEKGKLQIGS